MKKISLLVPAIFLVFTCCEKETDIADLTVGWTIGLESPDRDMCSRAGIADIHVLLDAVGDSYERYGVCEDAQIRFESIPLIGYEVEISGLNEDGCPIYYGSKYIDSGDVEKGPEILRLESLPSTGTVTIGWWFSDGRFCSHHGVDDVRVIIFMDDIEVANEEVDCESGMYKIEEAFAGRYSIRIEAEADEGLLCREYHDVNLRPCGVISAEGELEPCMEER